MTGRGTLLAAVLLGLAIPAQAHRLDEYLQAATIAVAADRVEVQLRLTPGADIADTVITGIDRDGDGAVSEAEWEIYATGVREDLLLEADGVALPLRPVDAGFAEIGRMKQGEATVLLVFQADLPPANGRRSLTFGNRHQSGMAVYMVNALVPRDPAVRILGQHRSPDQSSWRLDFMVAGRGN